MQQEPSAAVRRPWPRARRLLAHRRLPLVLAAFAVVLSAPSLWLGLQVDDYALRLALVRPAMAPEEARSPLRLFELIRDPEQVRRNLAAGFFPWWTSTKLRIAFFRPLTGLTHWVDFRLWPGQHWLMHLQSLSWFALVVAAVAFLFRRLLTPAWVAGLAGLLYAVDDAHGMAAAWLANRNALVAAAFSVLALLAHDRWRRDGWRPGLFAAPLALALGLCGGETAVAAGAYLLAYALFVDDGSWKSRIASLLPAGLVGLAWALVYRGLAYGTRDSGMYVSPLGDPARFARTVVERAPLLLCGQWLLPSELHLFLSREATSILWSGTVMLGVLLALLLAPLLRHDRTARFFAGGMLLSLVPACGAFPDDRLLVLVGVGGSGLLAQLLAGMATRAPWLPGARAWRGPATVAAVVLGLFHLILAPAGLVRGAAKMRLFGDIVDRAAASLPSGAGVRQQQVLIVQTPSAFVSAQGPLILATWKRPVPERTLVLGSGIHRMTVERPSQRSLRVRPEGGFLLPKGRAPEGRQQALPAFDVRYMFEPFDRLYRDGPMRLGERVVIPGVRIQVTKLTADGRPAEASFTFDRPLEDASLRWVRWSNGVYEPFDLPPIGGTITLPPVQVPLLARFSHRALEPPD